MLENIECRTIYILVTYVDYNVLVRAFNTHQLPFGLDMQDISVDNARQVLTTIYQLISTYHFHEATIDETVETLLRFIGEIMHEYMT
jgi:hypothetical protein